MKPNDREALESAVPGALEEHEPVAVDGLEIGVTLRPGDGDALGAALRALSERGLAAIVTGGASGLAPANPARRGDVLLSSAGLGGVRELDADEGVLRAGAGTPLAGLRKAVAGSGWELPLDPPGARRTLGGALAAAATGPCFGHPRDVVLGLDVVLASGARTRCGGRVVKNVTGYDLAKLYVGSLGSLAVIEAAWLRLRPVPEQREVRVGRLAADAEDDVATRVLAAARRPTARAAVWVDRALATGVPGDPRDDLLLVELAGDEAAVARDAAWLGETLDAHAAPESALATVRDLEGGDDEEALRFRLGARPSVLAGAVAEIRGAGGEILAHPARGWLQARFPAGTEAEPAALERAFAAVRRAAGRSGGSGFALESAPWRMRQAWAARGGDAFAVSADELAVFRALKQAYDPGGVLNPGRFAGGL